MITRAESDRRWRAVCEAVDADQVGKALDLFKDQASESAERFLNEAREGRGKCLEELADLAEED